MTPEQVARRAALERGRKLYLTGEWSFATLAAELKVPLRAVERAAAKGRWREARDAQGNAPAPPVRLAPGSADDLEARALAALDEAATSGRPLKVTDAIAIAEFAKERKAVEASQDRPDLSRLSDREVDDLEVLILKARGEAPERVEGWSTPTERLIAGLRAQLTAREAPVDLAPDLAAARAETEAAQAALVGARAQVEALRVDLVIARAERDQERARLAGLERLLEK